MKRKGVLSIEKLMAVKEICENLQAITGKKDKESILRQNYENQLLKDILQFIYNPYILTGLSDKKISKEVGFRPRTYIRDIYSAMDYLKKNNTGTDLDISTIQHFINSQQESLRPFLRQVFTKSLKLGCDVKTFNKVWGKHFIPEWEVQQAYSIEKYPLKKNEWFALSHKLNGNRCTYYKGKLISRQGQEFTGLQHIIDDIEFVGWQDYFIDGELVRENPTGVSDSENFRIGTGIINSDAETKPEIEFVIFDVLPAAEYEKNGGSELKYSDRMRCMADLKYDAIKTGVQNLRFVDMFYEGTDQTMIDKYLNLMEEQGKEGLILNRDTAYKSKRHSGILKVKKFYTMDLEVVGIEEGTGRLNGTLGALIVKFKDNTVNVGSGFDDETRRYIWENKDSIIGKVVEVKYKEVSKDKKTGLESLQFPIFVCIREDGKEVSYN